MTLTIAAIGLTCSLLGLLVNSFLIVFWCLHRRRMRTPRLAFLGLLMCIVGLPINAATVWQLSQ